MSIRKDLLGALGDVSVRRNGGENIRATAKASLRLWNYRLQQTVFKAIKRCARMFKFLPKLFRLLWHIYFLNRKIHRSNIAISFEGTHGLDEYMRAREICQQYERACEVRYVIMGVAVLLLVLATIGINYLDGDKNVWVVTLPISAMLLGIVFLLTTRYYCEPSVQCSRCNRSFWNYVSYRMLGKTFELSPSLKKCPGCGITIV